MSELITLSRDCEAIQVPYGNTITAREGTEVFVMQQLGDTFTVRSSQGYLMRIAGHDADALGLEPPADHTHDAVDPNTPVAEQSLWDALKTVFDPEIPANIVELGLIYTIQTAPRPSGGTNVAVEMTLTAPGCGMGQVLRDDVERKIAAVPGVAEVRVDMVFDPPWEPALMSEAARLQLGMF
jgi:probable FeS assembly SUF system protein SufT